MESEQRFARVYDFLRIRSTYSLYLYAVIIGNIAGFFALAFSYALGLVEHQLLGIWGGLDMTPPAGEFHFPGGGGTSNRWLLFLLPATGG